MSILIFENNAILANEIQTNLIAEGFFTVLIREPNEMPQEEAFWEEIELIILDLMMGDADLPEPWRKESKSGLVTGYVVYDKMVPNKDIPVLVLTGLKERNLLKQVQSSIKRCAVLEKPIHYDEFMKKIKQLL